MKEGAVYVHRKVFCNDCIYLRHERDLGFYDQLQLQSRRSGYSWENNKQYLCSYDMEDNTEERFDPIERTKFRTISVNDPLVLNVNNDCPHYKKKWWKFWIKKRTTVIKEMKEW